MPDKKCYSLMGITKANFEQLVLIFEKSGDVGYRSARNCLAMLLIKLWTGMSNNVIASLFNVDDSTVGRYISIAREKLIKEFVPKHLGIPLIFFNVIII